MSRIILDSSILISFWRQSRPRDLTRCTASDAEEWASRLIKIHQTNAIVTPVYLEVVGGVIHGHEMELTKAFLNCFKILDEGRLVEEDLTLARQFAERIPVGPEPSRRGAVDCLIKALARRFRCELRTRDKGMPR